MEHLGPFIINHWQLWLAFVFILFLILLNELNSQRKKAKELSPQSVIDMINNNEAMVVDLRDKEAFKKGHIIDSIQAKAEDFEQQKMNKYKNNPLILVCASGTLSPTVAAKIREKGYQPFVLQGGIAAWQNADLPLVKKG